MVKSTPLNSKGYGKKGANILQYLKNTEYYQGSDGKMQNPTRWIGDGPEALGLSGVVDHKALDLMAAGRGPNGEPLVANAGAEHNMGYDLTFSPFKTFSVAWARANPEERERLLGAHRAAVDLSLQYLKENLDVRAGAGGTERIGCSELFAAGFTHFTNRNLDPQVHEHVLLFNVVRGADGKTRSLNTRDLQQHVYVMDQIHKGALAHSLTEMGYAVNREIELHQHTGRETGHVRYDIDGISREVVLAESSRRLELVKYAEEHNVSYNQATLATRKSKDEPAFAELDPMWSQSFAPFVESGALPSNEQLKQRPQHDLAMRDDKVLVEKLHKTEANVTRRDVVALIAAEAGPAFGHDLQKLDRMVDDFMQRNDFVQKPENSRGQVMYTSRWAIETERSLVASDQALRANTAHNLPPELVQKAVDAFEKRKTEERLQKALDDLDAAKAAVTKASPDQQAKAAAKVAKAEAKVADARSAPPMKLTDEQRRNIDYAAMQTGGVANLVGRAGTGKTFTAQVFVDAYRAAGYDVLGVSGGWKATNKLAAEVEGLRTEHEQAMFGRAAAKSAAGRQALADTAREQLKGMGLDAATTAHDRRVDVVDAMAAEHAGRVRQTPDAPPVTAAVNPRDVPALNEAIRARMRADGSLTGDDVTLTVARGGDFNPTAFRPEPDARAVKNDDGDRYYRGTLVETGTGLVDPNDPTSKSPYAVIRSRDGHEHKVFGVDVAPAIERGGVQPGDTIELRRTGEQPVEITDRKTGETKTVLRNGWEAAPHDFAAHEQAQRVAHTAEVQRQRDTAEKPTGQAELKLAVGDTVTFGSRGAALYHGIDDPGARLTITAVDGTDPANPKATARWNGQDFTLTNGDQIEHAHAVPVWKAARDAKAADAPAPFVQIMASEADRIDPQALRDVQAGAESLHVHGTGRAFKATAHAHTEHQAQREHLVERTGEAVRSINATVTVSIAEKPEAAAKELAQAWVKCDTPERERRAVGGTPHDVARLTDAIRAAKREAGQLHGEDHAVRVRAGTTSVEMPVAAGDRMVLRTDKNLSLALPVKLEEPMNATLRLNTVGRGADGMLRATATVESSNERDRKHTVTLDEDHLKRFRHGYATTQKDAAKNPRPDVFALVGERDAPARVTAALESAGQTAVFTTPKAAERLAGHVETSAREAERAVQNAAKIAERATAGRDVIRAAMEKRQEQERARQQAAEAARAGAQRKAAEQAEAKAKQQQAEEKKKARERAWAKALVPQRGGGINL